MGHCGVVRLMGGSASSIVGSVIASGAALGRTAPPLLRGPKRQVALSEQLAGLADQLEVIVLQIPAEVFQPSTLLLELLHRHLGSNLREGLVA